MRSFFYYLAVPAILLSACQSGAVNETAQATTAYTEAADSTAFPNDMALLHSPSRKRVRSADVRCRVNNVLQATSLLEHTVSGMNGMIMESSIRNEYGATRDMPYTRDSLKRVRLYTPTASLALRVPVSGLDSIVHLLTGMAAFIEHRTLREQDKTLDYLSNALRNNETPATVKPDKKNTALDVATYEDIRKDRKIDRQIANLGILDDTHYATFSVELFQPAAADVVTVVHPDQIIRPAFGKEFSAALLGGLDACRSILLFFVRLWPFLLLLLAGWIGYRKLKNLRY